MPDLSAPLTTGVDDLIDIVNSRGSISFAEAATALKLPLATIESWATFLEEEHLLKVSYSFTKPYLVSVEAKKGAVQLLTEEVPLAAPTELGRTKDAAKQHAKQKGEAPPGTTPAPAAPVQEKPRSFDDLLQAARNALAKNDLAEAQRIYGMLETEYAPEKAQDENVITELSTLDDTYLMSVSEPDAASQQLAETVRYQLGEVQHHASIGELDEALDAFAKAQSAFSKLTPSASELHLSLTPLLAQAQQTLVDAELGIASRDWHTQLGRIQTLLDQLDAAIANEDVDAALALYEQIDAAKKTLPAEQKVEIETAALPAYEALINTQVDLARREVDQKLEMLNSVQERVTFAINNHDQQKAREMYELAKRVYLAIPNEFFERKVEAQRTLLGCAKRISELELELTRQGIAAQVESIGTLVDQATIMLQQGDVSSAHATYTDAVAAFAQLPRGFSALKVPLQKRLVGLYSQLLRHADTHVTPLTSATAHAAPMVMLPEPEFSLQDEQLKRIDIKGAMTRWKNAMAAQRWDDALAVAEELDGIVAEQATLLRDATALATLDDPSLPVALNDVYSRYNAVTASHPQDAVLYRHIKALYMNALARLKR